MWVREVRDVTTAGADAVWQRWVEVAGWPQHNGDLREVWLDGPLAVGTLIVMRPTSGRRTRAAITVLDKENYRFTNQSTVPFGFVRFEHEIVSSQQGRTEFVHRVSIKGPLTPVLRKVFADNMVAGLPKMLAAIARLAEAQEAARKP
jgi:hypothetical protein